MVSEVQQADTSTGSTNPGYFLWSLLLLSAALLGFIFYDGLELMVKWWERDEYSHGYMIPLVALYLMWQKQDKFAAAVKDTGGAWAGVVFLVLGVFIFLMGELSSLYTIIQYGFLLSLYAVVLAAFGWRASLVIWAALAYLIFMIPLPNFLYNTLSSELQLISSTIGVFVVRLFDISVYLEGNVIDLGSYKLQVVEACSGLRYLFPLMSFGFLIAYLYRGPIWQRAFLFLSTVPITVLMNSFRIGVIGVTVEYWGIEMAEGFLHDFEGWVIFMGCLGVLALEMAAFHYFSKSSGSFFDRLDLEGPEKSVGLSDFGFSTAKQKPLIAAAVILLISSIGVMVLGERVEEPRERKSFSEFPLYHNGWSGRERAIEADILDELQLTDYIQANFRNKMHAAPVNFYVAYYASQTKGASIHSPKSCLPGDGWLLTGLTEKEIPGVTNFSGEPLVVNRALMKKGEAAQIVYYWFEQRGRNITNEYAAKWYLFVDSITQNRTDGALLRVVVPVPDLAKLEEFEATADQFLVDIYPFVGDYIPGKTITN
jgi:exosortase D (VPLPA-CTERM-specific)